MQEGELYVRGPAVFDRYYGRPDATECAFALGGWFRTGDIARRSADGYAILGRASVDVMKSSGYKISALEIERKLLEWAEITEIAVLGVHSDAYGQRVAAVVVPARTPPEGLGDDDRMLEALRDFGASRLARYKLPTRLRAVSAIPKNAVGKINKKELARLFDDE